MRYLVLLACLASGCGKLLGIDELAGPGPGGDGSVPGDGSSGPEFCKSHGIDACGLVSGGAVTLGEGVLDTGGDALCQTANVLACVIYADTIAVPQGVTVSLRGAKPIVLFARRSIQIDGVLDASSYISSVPTLTTRGAGATGIRCAPGLTRNGPGSPGGSFQGKGGKGGNSSVLPEAAQGAPEVPRGGCPGGDASSGGRPSPPGGSVWLLAGDAITIGAKGVVAANGAGGAGGDAAGLGGFGGGSGGYLLLAAPQVDHEGVLSANGGGGGGGGKSDDGGGDLGIDGTASETRSPGGTGVPPGGAGGHGAAAMSFDGENGAASSDVSQAGGGGGGGGAGWIVVDSTHVSLTGVISPPPALPI